MTRYVLGFAFDEAVHSVALIKKLRPAWQENHFNGIGGHIEADETSLQAMEREFKKETGVDIPSFRQYGSLHGEGFYISLFVAVTDLIYQVNTVTDEEVRIYEVEAIQRISFPVIPNLRWLIPMAMSFRLGEHARSFEIQEN